LGGWKKKENAKRGGNEYAMDWRRIALLTYPALKGKGRCPKKRRKGNGSSRRKRKEDGSKIEYVLRTSCQGMGLRFVVGGCQEGINLVAGSGKGRGRAGCELKPL